MKVNVIVQLSPVQDRQPGAARGHMVTTSGGWWWPKSPLLFWSCHPLKMPAEEWQAFKPGWHQKTWEAQRLIIKMSILPNSEACRDETQNEASFCQHLFWEVRTNLTKVSALKSQMCCFSSVTNYPCRGSSSHTSYVSAQAGVMPQRALHTRDQERGLHDAPGLNTSLLGR